ncbi:MAG: aryl-sulfate sulfotransferase [Planctomycetes bacterium]|nr:aryl-sulfate sulfotransferase [Planctomycetota bacterium]
MSHPARLGVVASLLASAAFGQEPATPVTPRGLVSHDAAAFDGYTLFSPLRSTKTYLVDFDGKLVHEWETGVPTGALAELQSDGSILRTFRDDENPRFFGGGLGGKLQRFAWDGALTWEYTLSDDTRVMHHDFEVLPNGNVLAIAWENVTKEAATALGRDPKQTDERGWWPDCVVEIQPTLPKGGTIVWEWHAKDHLIQDADPAKPNYGDVTAHPELFDINGDHRNEPPLSKADREERERQEREMRGLGYTGGKDDDDAKPPKPKGDAPELDPDWMHTNAVHYHAKYDLLVLSSPRLDELWILDHSTTTAEAKSHAGGRWKHGGDVLWRWGNPQNYGAGKKSDQKLFGQHDARFLAGDKLALTVFNNGLERPDGKFSSVDELVLPFDPARGFTRNAAAAFGPSELAWTFKAEDPTTLFSFFISGAERLPNGDTLICSGAQGRFLEVAHDGRVVWEYLNPYGGEIEHSFGHASKRPSKVDPNAVFRCMRYASDHPGLRALKH